MPLLSVLGGAGCVVVGAIIGIVIYRCVYLRRCPPIGARLLEFIEQTDFSDGTLQEFRAILNGTEVRLVFIDCNLSDAVKNALPREAVVFDPTDRGEGRYDVRSVVLCRI